MKTLIGIQEKQIAAELAAVAKHGNSITARSVIYSARTRATKELMSLGFSLREARDAVTDARDVAMLQLAAEVA